MSIKIMSNVWDTSHSNGPQLLVELALADFANDEGRCYPAVATLARKARCSESTVHNVLRRLQREHRITVDPEASDFGTNIFTWQHEGRFDKGPAHRGASGAPPAPGDTGGVHAEPPGGVHEGGVHGAPDPSLIHKGSPPAEPSDRAITQEAGRAKVPLSEDVVAPAREKAPARSGARVSMPEEGGMDRQQAFAQALFVQCQPEELDGLHLGEEGDYVIIGGPQTAIDALRASRLVQLAGAAARIGYRGVKYSAGGEAA